MPLKREFADKVGRSRYVAALSSETAVLYLTLRYAGIGAGNEVFCSTFTFVVSANINIILYQGARSVFVDSDYAAWNMDVGLLAAALA